MPCENLTNIIDTERRRKSMYRTLALMSADRGEFLGDESTLRVKRFHAIGSGVKGIKSRRLAKRSLDSLPRGRPCNHSRDERWQCLDLNRLAHSIKRAQVLEDAIPLDVRTHVNFLPDSRRPAPSSTIV
jgi:hypothetical protein